jgi:hypothetical protein
LETRNCGATGVGHLSLSQTGPRNRGESEATSKKKLSH